MNKAKVLLVEPGADIQDNLVSYIRNIAQVEIVVTNDFLTISQIRAAKEDYSAILLDLTNKKSGGLAILRTCRREAPELPVIVFTDKNNSKGVEPQLESAYRVLYKPIEFRELEKTISSLVNQDSHLRMLAITTRHLSKADMCILWQLDKSRQHFFITAWDGIVELDENYRKNILSAKAFPIRKLFARGKPLYVADISDPIIAPLYKHHEDTQKYGWVSLISLPLIQNGQLIGLLDNYWLQHYSFPNLTVKNRTLEMMAAWADQLAAILRNKEMHSQLQGLLEINKLLSGSMDETQIIYQILIKGLELVGSEMGWLCQVDPEKNEFTIQACKGIKGVQPGDHHPFANSLTGEVAQTGVPLNFSNSGIDDHPFDSFGNTIQSEIVIPLKRDEQIIGVLSAMSQYQNYFKEEDVNLLEAFSSQAVLAVERARVNEYTRRVSENAVEGGNSLFETVVEAAYKLTGKYATFWLLDASQKHLIKEAERGDNQKFARETYLELDDSQIEIIFQNHEVITIQDINDESVEFHFTRKNRWAKYLSRSAMIVPLFDSRNKPLGALCLFGKAKQDFHQWEKDLISGFANQVSIAFENTRYITTEQNLRKQAQALFDISTIASSPELDSQKIALLILKRIRQHIGFRRASIQRIDGNQRKLITGVGFRLNIINPLHIRPISDDPLVSRVINNKDILILEDTDKVPDWDPLPNTRSWVCVPLIGNGIVFGLLTLDHQQKGYFTNVNRNLLMGIGNQVALALQKSELLGELKLQNNRLKTINHFSNYINSLLDEKKIYRALSSAVVDTLNCSHCTIFRIEGTKLIPYAAFNKTVMTTITREFLIGEGFAGYVALTGEPIFSNNARSDYRFLVGKIKPDSDRSMIVVPIKNGNQIAAVISADQDSTNAFYENDYQMVLTLAYQASVSLQNASLFKKEQQRTNAMKLLQKIGAKINQPNKINDLLETIMVGALKLTNTERGEIHLVNRSRTKLIKSSAYPKGLELLPTGFEKRAGILWNVIQLGQRIIISDTHNDPTVSQAVRDANIKAMLGIPLKVNTETIGALFVDETSDSREFSEFEINLLSTLADQAAVAISNSRQYKLLEGLAKSGHSLTRPATNERKILSELVKYTKEVLDCDIAAIFPFDNENKQFNLESAVVEGLGNHVNFEDYWRQEDFGRGKGVIISRIFSQGILPIEDVDNSENYPFLNRRPDSLIVRVGIKAFVGVLLHVAGENIGILYVDYFRTRHFSEAELGAIRLLADQTAIALKNTRLLEQERKWSNQLTHLQEIGIGITSKLDLNDVLGSIVESSTEILAADFSTLFTFNNDTDEFEFGIRRGTIDFTPAFPGRNGFWAHFTKKGKSLFVDNVSKNKKVCSNFVINRGIKSVAAVPLKYQNRPIGLLFVNFVEHHQFNEKEEKTIQLLGSQAAVAIVNAHSFEQRKKDIATLQGINQAITTKNFDHVANLIAQAGCELTQADACELWIKKGNILNLAATFSMNERGRVKKERLQIDGHSINGWVVMNNESYNSSNVQDDIHYHKARENIRSNMAVPMRMNNQPVGTLSVEDRKFNAFSDYEIGLLQAIADQAAIAIENTQLFFKEIQEKADYLERLHSISTAISTKQTDLSEVLRLIVDHLKSMYPGSSAALRMYNPIRKELGNKFAAGNLADYWIEPRKDGTTKYVIDNKTSLFIENILNPNQNDLPFVRKELVNKGVASIAYLPMILEDKVIGILYLNLTEQHEFHDDEKKLLQIFADEAAIAIENARLYGDVAENWGVFIREHYALDLVHRLNNMLGTIPARMDIVRENLKKPGRDQVIQRHLAGAAADARKVMQEAKQLQIIPKNEEISDLKIMVQAIAEEAWVNSLNKIQTEIESPEELPPVHTIRINLLYAIYSIVDNAVQAIKEDGGHIKIVLKPHIDKEIMEIRISDDGPKIPTNIRDKIFRAGFTTKSEGNGYGLWRARKLIELLNGSLTLEEPQPQELVKTFSIQIPFRNFEND